MRNILTDCEQKVILEKFDALPQEGKVKAAAQIQALAKSTPGGLKDYVMRGRKFLIDSKNNVNPFEHFKPQTPEGVFLKPFTPEMDKFESKGYEELAKLGIVLIAGGLGERLGYSGIKIALPVCTMEAKEGELYSYLKFYTQFCHSI